MTETLISIRLFASLGGCAEEITEVLEVPLVNVGNLYLHGISLSMLGGL